MGVEDIFLWYQKNIGAYDKQQWETKIEKREQIICGLTHVQMRSTKPNTNLIDLDLVRGSSFTKAKPQHGFLKVARLATLRCILLPFYGKWWVHCTSAGLFAFALTLYILQVINIVVYFAYYRNDNVESEGISGMEIGVPLVMMWLLSLIHSQIVATSPTLDDKKTSTEADDRKSRPFRRRRSNLRQHRRLEKGKEGRNNKSEKPQKKLKFNDVVRIDEQSSSETSRSHLNLERHQTGTIIDDGFESLNGNGSRTSEEEIVPSTSQSGCATNPDPTEGAPPSHPLQCNSGKSDNVEAAIESEESHSWPCISCHSCLKEKCDGLIGKSSSDTEAVRGVGSKGCTSCWGRPLEDSLQMPTKNLSRDTQVCSTDSESDGTSPFKSYKIKKPQLVKRRNSHIPTINITSTVDSTCDTEDEALSSPETLISNPLLVGEVTSSTNEWIGVTTNSEDCSYSSDMDDVSAARLEHFADDSLLDNELAPTAILNPPSVKVSCTIWEQDEIKKADLSMLDISCAIIGKVDTMPASMDYFYIGMVFSVVLAFLPVFCRFSSSFSPGDGTERNDDFSFMGEVYKNITNVFLLSSSTNSSSCFMEAYILFMQVLPSRLNTILDTALGTSVWERTIILIALIQRWILSSVIFFLLSVAERTFKQRLTYAKLFSHLTSSRRARKSQVPHFRLNKVRNIKTWLSVRSYLKKRGPQRSVDVIVSTAFIVTLLLLTFLCVELLKETVSFSQYYLEAMLWGLGIGILLLRFMTLGTKINKKYRNLSVLITEQINLHLQIEQKPHKKDELTVANNVLKLAIDLLKELENPFKISGLSANPILYNVTKLVILSALSGVLSEMLGFKLKLHKIKLK